MKMPNPSMIKGSMMMKYIVSFPNILVKNAKANIIKNTKFNKLNSVVLFITESILKLMSVQRYLIIVR